VIGNYGVDGMNTEYDTHSGETASTCLLQKGVLEERRKLEA